VNGRKRQQLCEDGKLLVRRDLRTLVHKFGNVSRYALGRRVIGAALSFFMRAVCIMAILAASACAPRLQDQYRPTEDGETKETLLELRLVEASPSLRIISGPPIKIERIVTAKSKFIGSGWYTFRTSRFFANGKISISGQDIDLNVGVTEVDIKSVDQAEGRTTSSPLGLSIKIAKRGKTSIQIDWNKVSIVDGAGNAHPVIHRGIQFTERSMMAAPSVIAPGATLDDFVYPSDFIGLQAKSKFGSQTWLGNNFIEAMRPGEGFRLHMPLGEEAGVTECQFVFEVGKPNS
jgi:hypothetical protein